MKPKREKYVKASELPANWKPGDSGIILDDDCMPLPPELLDPPVMSPAPHVVPRE